MAWLHKSTGISRATSANLKQTEIQCSQADSCVHEVCLQIMMVGSEVQQIRGWGKQSGELPPGEISGSCRGSGAGSQCTVLGPPGRAGRGQVPTGHQSSTALAASTLLSCAVPEHSPGRGTRGHHRGMCWEQWRVPGWGWWEVGEGDGHGWCPQQAEGSKRCSAKTTHACLSSHNGPLSMPVTAGMMSLPLLPERAASPTVPVAVTGKMRIIRRRCLLLQVSLKAWQSPTLGGPLISAFETV